ncbi:MAG: hypothetical protein KF850_32615, partial [Labilithrix sp.]|nr:hypothetical protein [Labilithrix sp.]
MFARSAPRARVPHSPPARSRARLTAQLAAALVLTLDAACTKSESGPPAPEASTRLAPPAEPA